MHVWTGWTAASESAVKTALTWEEWCACQRRLLGSEQREQDGSPFSERELARLSFVRWLYQTDCLAPAHCDYD